MDNWRRASSGGGALEVAFARTISSVGGLSAGAGAGLPKATMLSVIKHHPILSEDVSL